MVIPRIKVGIAELRLGAVKPAFDCVSVKRRLSLGPPFLPPGSQLLPERRRIPEADTTVSNSENVEQPRMDARYYHF